MKERWCCYRFRHRSRSHLLLFSSLSHSVLEGGQIVLMAKYWVGPERRDEIGTPSVFLLLLKKKKPSKITFGFYSCVDVDVVDVVVVIVVRANQCKQKAGLNVRLSHEPKSWSSTIHYLRGTTCNAYEVSDISDISTALKHAVCTHKLHH